MLVSTVQHPMLFTALVHYRRNGSHLVAGDRRHMRTAAAQRLRQCRKAQNSLPVGSRRSRCHRRYGPCTLPSATGAIIGTGRRSRRSDDRRNTTASRLQSELCMSNKAAIPRATGQWLLGSALDFTRAPHLFAANLPATMAVSPRFGRCTINSSSHRAPKSPIIFLCPGEITGGVAPSTESSPPCSATVCWPPRAMSGGAIIASFSRCCGEARWRRSRRWRDGPRTRMLEAWRRKSLSGETVSIVHETRSLALDVIAKKLLSVTLDDEEQARFGDAMREAMLLLRQRSSHLNARCADPLADAAQ